MESIISQTGTYLTHLSGNYLDWFNVGGLARHRARETIAGLWSHYSWRELFIRGGMITSTILLAAYGGQPTNPEANFSYGRAFVYGTAGFFVTHGIAVLPTVLRRHKIVTQTNDICDQIMNKLTQIKQNNEDIAELIFNKVKLIQEHNFPALKRGDAAVNLIHKKSLMKTINSELTSLLENTNNDFNEIVNFWKQDVTILIKHFDEINNPDSNKFSIMP